VPPSPHPPTHAPARAPPSLAEEFALAKGGRIGYWQGEIPKVLADIGACQPTLFCGVPRVFDRIYAGINDNLAGSLLKRVMFMLCLARKKAAMMAGYKHDVVRAKGRGGFRGGVGGVAGVDAGALAGVGGRGRV
jgi:hypothetical protein